MIINGKKEKGVDFTFSAAYSGTALAFRDRLVIDWNKTQQRQTFADQKRIYCKLMTGAISKRGGAALNVIRSFARILDGKSS